MRLDPDAFGRLAAFHGEVIAIEPRGLDMRLYLRPTPDGLQIFGNYDGTPDAVLSGAPLTLARIATERGTQGTLFSGDVEIRGDVELGRRFKEFLDSVEVDWEEQLSRIVGDVVAHRAAYAARSIAVWGKQALDSLSRDTVEYLQEERRQVPSKNEVQSFLTDVDELRSDADRLEARVRRLEAKLSSDIVSG
ncbi:MAG: SCP2 sterol-binding domain-containing protein [Gammaproteobacteria bacterium]